MTTISQLYKQHNICQSQLRGPRIKLQKLMRLIVSANYLCWSRKFENKDVASDILWAHFDSIKLLNMFLTVLIMDNMHKINQYRLPLVEIVSVTSTKLTFSVAFTYLSADTLINPVLKQKNQIRKKTR